jgi:hypothetical protein
VCLGSTNTAAMCSSGVSLAASPAAAAGSTRVPTVARCCYRARSGMIWVYLHMRACFEPAAGPISHQAAAGGDAVLISELRTFQNAKAVRYPVCQSS